MPPGEKMRLQVLRIAIGNWMLVGVAGLQLAGCSKAPPSPPAPPRQAPAPATGALQNLTLPEGDGRGGFKTMNSGIGPAEAVWHVRAALNVAALACDDRVLIANYNALLKRQKGVLAAAYQSESRQSGSASAMDSHMTRLYNFFAQPFTQREFCNVAGRVAADAQSIPGPEFARFAVAVIERVDRPFQDFYRAYQTYQRDLVAWRAEGGRVTEQPALPTATLRKESITNMALWRVQLGAFSGSGAAHVAWDAVRKRAPGLAAFQPHYETAPTKGLVRLQIGPASDRSEALRLCAAAAVAALDCLPISPKE